MQEDTLGVDDKPRCLRRNGTLFGMDRHHHPIAEGRVSGKKYQVIKLRRLAASSGFLLFLVIEMFTFKQQYFFILRNLHSCFEFSTSLMEFHKKPKTLQIQKVIIFQETHKIVLEVNGNLHVL